MGLLVNVVGLFFFHDLHSHGHSHDGDGCGHGHDESNMRGIYLHILADALGSVGVICSSLLIKYFVSPFSHSNSCIADAISGLELG